MAWNKNWKLQFYLMCVLFFSNISISNAVARSAIHEKIEYHLGELKKGLQELRESNGHIIHKRSVLNHDEIIYNSLMVFCNEMNSGADSLSSTAAKPDRTASSLSSSVKKKRKKRKKGIFSVKENKKKESSVKKTFRHSLQSLAVPDHKKAVISDITPVSSWPHLFPRKVQAERDGSDVWLVFDIIHTAPVYVTQYYSFDTPIFVIDYPENLFSSSLSPSSSQSSNLTLSPSPMVSRVRLRVDASQCVNADFLTDIENPKIGFTLLGNTVYHMATNINVCKFDRYYVWAKDFSSGQNLERTEKIITENLPMPYYKITPSDPGHEILIQRGQDVVLYLDIYFNSDTIMDFSLQIWDQGNKNKTLKANSRFYCDIISAEIMPTKTDLLSVERLDVSKFGNKNNETVYSDDEEYRHRAKVKITVNVSNGKRSGKLSIFYYKSRLGSEYPKIVKFISSEREILLKLPNRANVLPKKQVEISTPHEGFTCGKNPMRRYQITGKNCTVHCYAYGTNIKDIFISDTNSSRSPPVNSVSQVFGDGNSAYAMIDVGPASKDIEGTYRCTAVTTNGKRWRQDVKLFTSQFTVIEYHDINITEFNNDTTKITCEAFGAQPLNMSISIQKYEGMNERLDNKLINNRSISINGNLSTLTLFLSTDQLRYPAEEIVCNANGERGSGYYLHRLKYWISNQNPLLPKINTMLNASRLKYLENDKVEIRCTATGGKPMEMWMVMYRGGEGKTRIDNKPENIRTTEDTPDGKVLTVIISESSLPNRRYRSIVCKVSNRFNNDSYSPRAMNKRSCGNFCW